MTSIQLLIYYAFCYGRPILRFRMM